MQPAVAKNENVLVMTSSPGPMPSAISTARMRVRAGGDGNRLGHSELGRQLTLERLDLGAHDEPLAVADPRDRCQQLVAQRPILRLEIEERHGGARGGCHRTTISGEPHSARSLSWLLPLFGSLAFVFRITATCSPA